MFGSALRRWLFVVLALAPCLAQAKDPLPATPTSETTAAALGTRVDALQNLLDQVRDAHGEPLRQAAMERHWKAMQDYMQESLKLTARDPAASDPRARCGPAIT
jgi:hypothetical protein